MKLLVSLLFLVTFLTKVSAQTTFKPNLYIVCIGVSEYKNYPESKLKYADKDARDVLAKFRASDNYAKVIPFLLTNDTASRKHILSLREELMKSTVDDQVVLFFSGHGMLDTASFDFYFCTYDIDKKQPATTGVKFEEMEYLLDSIPARRKLFLIDACHSGEVDKVELKGQKNAPLPSGVTQVNSKPFAPVSASMSQYVFDMMKEFFVDMRKATGSTVIASSGGVKLSYEKDKWQNGLFTWALVNCLKKGDTISKLTEEVIQMVNKMSEGRQLPVVREENIEIDHIVW